MMKRPRRPKVTIAQLLRTDGRWPLPKGRCFATFTFPRPVQMYDGDELVCTFTYTAEEER